MCTTLTAAQNHSCDPNCMMLACYINEADLRKPLLSLWTRRDISAGEELCFSYYGPPDEDEVVGSHICPSDAYCPNGQYSAIQQNTVTRCMLAVGAAPRIAGRGCLSDSFCGCSSDFSCGCFCGSCCLYIISVCILQLGGICCFKAGARRNHYESAARSQGRCLQTSEIRCSPPVRTAPSSHSSPLHPPATTHIMAETPAQLTELDLQQMFTCLSCTIAFLTAEEQRASAL